MSDVLKFSGPIKVGNLAADPANPENGYIYYNTTTGNYRIYENGAFRVISAEELAKLGTLPTSPSNYTPSSATYSGHLEGIDTALGNVSSDASGVTYTPADNNNWDGNADPGNVNDGLDQLASRVSTNETAIAAKADQSTVTEIDGNVDDLIALSGMPENSTNLGTFSGSTIPDNSTNKGALQALETSNEGKASTALDNLTTTSINQNLLPDANNTRRLGNETLAWGEADIVNINHTGDNNLALQFITAGQITLNKNLVPFSNNTSNLGSTANNMAELNARQLLSNDVLTLNGTNINVSGKQIKSLAEPTAGSDAATKSYVDSALEGLKPKAGVRVATTAAGALATDFENGDTVDGVTLVTGDRILIKNQADASENGIYVVNASGAPTRAADFDETSPVNEVNGAYTAVQEGTENAGKNFVQQGSVTTIDTDPINFVFFNSSANLVGGDGITVSGTNISVDHDGEGLDFNGSNQLTLELDGGTLSKSAAGLKVADNSIGDTQISNVSANLIGNGDVDNTELSFLNGVTSAVQTQLDAKLENVSEDTTPSLGGNLDTAGNAILHDGDGVKRGNAASPANLVEEEYIDSIALAASQTNTVIADLTFAHASFEGMEIVYKIKEATSNDVKIGTIRVATNGTDIVLNDIGTETNDTGVTFSAVVDGANVNIRYSSGANAATMRADVKRIRA